MGESLACSSHSENPGTRVSDGETDRENIWKGSVKAKSYGALETVGTVIFSNWHGTLLSWVVI